MKETGLTGKRRSTTIAATPDDGKSQRKRRRYDFIKKKCNCNLNLIRITGTSGYHFSLHFSHI